MKRTIEDFNPDVKVMNFAEHQDFLKAFNAGDDYFGFNEFVRRDAWDDTLKGEGVTYLVFNTIGDGKKEYKELVAYYTLSVTAIPYIDRIRLDEEERKETGKEFDEETYAIPAIEIKMFAVAEKYQDLFYTYDGEEKPISAWVFEQIIDYITQLMYSVVGLKAIFLHAADENAEKFYLRNKFSFIEKNMHPLKSLDDDLKAMYMALQEVHMNYDE